MRLLSFALAVLVGIFIGCFTFSDEDRVLLYYSGHGYRSDPVACAPKATLMKEVSTGWFGSRLEGRGTAHGAKWIVVDACQNGLPQDPKPQDAKAVLVSGEVPSRSAAEASHLEDRLSGGTFKVLVPDYETVITDLRREIGDVRQQQTTVLMWLLGGLASLVMLLLGGVAFLTRKATVLLDRYLTATEVPRRSPRRARGPQKESDQT